ncbi:hydantoin racemase (plasmid) [Ketogulonicigenium vulgare Y25]|uniref:Hydantoin racemase n=1 Tax=Ketogulonicigenium vulgare (strain WSH-001) TaxID=759362 RepID=F9YBF1_KETVW|nr:aspartate/glutamate racemase family protein [Ketogulonicigenium vulgare]ADO44266.1 hydantoin racemase [Ketogulonicigenium vulgare Y25]AEM42703.1 Hydantoin racemase [Ketogulonicigenium vulgare WSH-001]ALJ82847.1 hydantoin racemase [Ketogulonicigenium vulgare]
MGARILWVNTVGWEAYDQPIADVLSAIKAKDTEVEVVSLSLAGRLTHVEYRAYEALTYPAIVGLARDAGQRDFDAMVVGCFYDPAVKEAREVSGRTHVIGPMLAAVQLATTVANRFSVLVTRRKCIDQMTDRIREYGAAHRLASMRDLQIGVESLQKDPNATARAIIEQGRRAIDEDGAEAILLGCTCEFGFHEEAQQILGVPVIDAVSAPFKLAEHLAGLKRQLGWVPSRVGSCEPPPEDEIDRFGLFQGPVSVGNRILLT